MIRTKKAQYLSQVHKLVSKTASYFGIYINQN